MAHWSKGISDSDLLFNQYSFPDTIDREDRLVDGHLHVAKSNSPAINVLSNGSNSIYKNIHRCDSNELFKCHQSAEYLIAEKSRYEDSVLHKRVKLHEADEVLSDSLRLHKLPNSSINRESCEKCYSLNFKNVSSKEDHFPMSVSWKTQRSKRGTGYTPCGPMASELSEPEPMHKESGQSRITELATGFSFQVNGISEAIKDSTIYPDYFMSPNAGDLFIHEMSNVETQNHSRKNLGSSSSYCMLDEHDAIAEFSSCKLGFCNLSGPSTSRFATQMKNNENTISDIGAKSSCSQERSMRMKRVSSSGGFNGHVRVHQSANKIRSCSVRNFEAFRMDAISKYMENINRESQKISSSFQYSLSTKKVDTELPHGEQQYAISEESTKGFSGDGGESARSDVHMMGTSKSSPVKVASTSNYACGKQISLGGTISHDTHKDLINPRLIKFHTDLASMVKQGPNRGAEVDMFDTDLCCLTSSDVKEPNTCQKQSLDQTPFRAQKPNAYNAGAAKESSIKDYVGGRWLKRLKHDDSDSFCCNVKKSRHGDGPLTREASVIDYDAYTPETIKSQHIDERNLPSDTVCRTDVSPKVIKSWVGRWCRNGSQVASALEKLATADSLKPGNSKPLSSCSEGRMFPSVGAMALMGKVMNNSQKCEYQRKGSSIVWKVRDL